MPLDVAPPLANPARVSRLALATAWAPPPPIDYSEWARKNVVFGNESPKPGPYDPDFHPWDRHILACFAPDHPARIVVLIGAAQVIGKTTMAQVFVGGSQDMDPGPLIYYHPTEPNAVKWVKTKWRPFVRGTKPLEKLFPFDRSRDGGNAILYQERADGRGHIQVSGANSASALSMVSTPRQVQDDLAKWEPLPAGDPEDQADSRSEAFAWAKIFKVGTPLVKPGCRMTAAYNRSTQAEFHVPCPHCGEYQALTWENLKPSFDAIDEARKSGATPEEEPVAHFNCVACGCEILEKHRRAMVAQLKPVMKNPGAQRFAIYGFMVWAAYATSKPLAELAEDWFKAKGDPEREKVFYNDKLGLAYEIAGEAPAWEKLKERAEVSGLDLGRIPKGGLLICVGVDCQSDRVEVHVKAYGRDRRRWTVEYIVIPGHISDDECRMALDRLLKRTWPDSFGNRRGIDMMAIDAGYAKSDVRDFVKKHPQTRVIMVRGVSGDAAPEVSLVKQERDRDGTLIKYQRRYWNVGAAPLKASLYKNLTKTDPEKRGFCGYPAGLTDEFYQQLTAERRVAHHTRWGKTEYRWEKPKDQANEVLDTEIYAEAAATVWGWKRMTDQAWDRLEAQREQPPADRQLDLEAFAAGHVQDAVAAPEAGPADRPRHSDHRNGANGVRGRTVSGVGRRVTARDT